MKAVYLALAWCLALVSMTTAQIDKNERVLEPFNELKVFDGLQVTLKPGKENRVEITGEHLHKVSVVQKGKLLKLRLEIDKIFSGKRTLITVFYTEQPRVVDANEEARIVWQEGAKADRLEVKAQEGGTIYLDAELTQLVAKADTGGNLFVTGKTRFQDVRISTGGLMSAEEFNAEYTTVRVDAGGRAELRSTEYVNAEVRAGGRIRIFGDPLKMDEKTFIGGVIERVKD